MIRCGAFYRSALTMLRQLSTAPLQAAWCKAGLGILDVNHWRRPSSASWHRAAPREYPSIGLLCEDDLTKPDIIEPLLVTQTGPSSSLNDPLIIIYYYSAAALHPPPCEREYLFGGGECQPANALSRGRWTSTLSG